MPEMARGLNALKITVERRSECLLEDIAGNGLFLGFVEGADNEKLTKQTSTSESGRDDINKELGADHHHGTLIQF